MAFAIQSYTGKHSKWVLVLNGPKHPLPRARLPSYYRRPQPSLSSFSIHPPTYLNLLLPYSISPTLKLWEEEDSPLNCLSLFHKSKESLNHHHRQYPFSFSAIYIHTLELLHTQLPIHPTLPGALVLDTFGLTLTPVSKKGH